MIFYFILVILYVIKFLYSLNVGLIPDEAYYWVWSRNLDLSYYDQGPGVALYIRFFTTLFGESLFALRLAANFASLFTSISIFLISDLLNFSNRQKIYLLLFIFFIPAFFGGGFLIMHDSPLLLSWSLSLYFTIKYLKERRNLFIYIIFFFLGTGALSKHTMIFYVFSLILWIIFSPSEYKLLKNIHIYIGILLTALIISPVIFWNLNNDWDNIDAILNLRSAGSVNVKKFNTGNMIVGQILSISPILYFLIGFVFIKYLYYSLLSYKSTNLKLQDNLELQKNIQSNQKISLFDRVQIFSRIYSFTILFLNYIKIFIRNEDNKISIYKFLIINSIVLPFFFLIMSVYRVVQANWLYASFLPISILFSYLLKEDKLEKFLFSLGLIVAILMDLFTIFSIPISKFLNLKLDPYYILGNRNLGYNEIIQDILKLKEEKYPQATIIANRYQDAAILSWYLPDKPIVDSMNILQKNQYNYWLNMEKGRDYILVYIQEKTCSKAFIFFQPILYEMFETVVEYPEKEIILDQYLVKRYQIWYLKNYQKDWAEDMRNIIQEDIIEDGILVGLKNPKELKTYQLKKTDYNGIELLHNYMDRAGDLECSFLIKK